MALRSHNPIRLRSRSPWPPEQSQAASLVHQARQTQVGQDVRMGMALSS
jgi:hypothetical protein